MLSGSSNDAATAIFSLKNPPMDASAARSLSHHSTESFQSNVSDGSTPPTPTFSARTHSRYPSSASSLSSTPPTHDFCDALGSSVKLPKLAEEPIEREHEHDHDHDVIMAGSNLNSPCLCDVEVCQHQQQHSYSGLPLPTPTEDDISDGYFSNDSDFTAQPTKRRRSGDSQQRSVVGRIESRIPSFARKFRERNRGSLSVKTRASTPSRGPSSRSSSFTSANAAGLEQFESHFFPSPALSAGGRHGSFTDSQPSPANASIRDVTVEDPIDREALASTPLLPPTMLKLHTEQDVPIQSPLQSPSIAEPPTPWSAHDTPAGTPKVRCAPTPPLSHMPSLVSLSAARAGAVEATSPIMMSVPADRWSDELGHANFTIEPEPYLPEAPDAAAARRLFADWELARCNFMKHQVRTGDNYGVNSRVYRLTEHKWAEVDAQWRRNHDAVTARLVAAYPRISSAAGGAGAGTPAAAVAVSPSEPAPLVKLPSLEELQRKGKMPAIGDNDIVGPMVQVAARTPCRSPRRSAFGRFFSGLRSPRRVFTR